MAEPRNILLVEDNDDDAEMTVRAFSRAHITNPIIRVGDGVAALNYLHERGSEFERDPSVLPILVLLDLNLPRIDGIEVLKAIRGNEHTRFLPVVMLTSSDHDRDRLAAYQHHVNSYIKKPVNFNEFVEVARQLGLYWVVLNLAAPAAGKP